MDYAAPPPLERSTERSRAHTRMTGLARAGLAALGLALATAACAHAGDVDRLDESLALCTAADMLPLVERRLALVHGLALAEDALARGERSARAHFAVVCSLGKALGLDGVGFGTFGDVSRLRREIDVTLRLEPTHAEALAAKGALLLRLPRLLGGDAVEAERWLRRALAIEPANATARIYLEEIETRRAFITPASDTIERD
jgi:hypothetical protein